MTTRILPKTLLPFLLISACDQVQSPSPEPRSFAPRLAVVPSGTQFIRVEVASWDLGNQTSGNNSIQQMEAPVSQGSITVNGLPSSGPLYFRVSGLDSSRSPTWWISRPFGSDNQPKVTIGGPSGLAVTTLAAPSITPITSGSGSSSSQVQIQCASGMPAWTFDGIPPGSTHSYSKSGNGNTTQTSVGSGMVLMARCTDGYGWSPVQIWKDNGGLSGMPSAGGPLPQVQFTPPSSYPGPLVFNIPTTAATANYSNWTVLYKLNSASSWAQLTLPSSLNVGSPSSLTAYLVAQSTGSQTWVSGPINQINLPVTIPVVGGGPLPQPVINLPAVIPGGTATITVSGGFPSGSKYVDWLAMVQTPTSGGNFQPYVFSGSQASFNINANGTITAFLVAWDPNTSQWVTGPSLSTPTQTTPPEPGTQLPKVVINPPANLGGAVTFSVPQGVEAYPTYQNWQVMYEGPNNPGNFQQIPCTQSFQTSTPGRVVAYLIAWDTVSHGWVSGPTDTEQVPAAIPRPGGTLPKILITPPPSMPGNVNFAIPNMSSYGNLSNWTVLYRLGNALDTNWMTQAAGANNNVGISTGTTVTAYAAAWNNSTNSWMTGPESTLVVGSYTVTLAAPTFSNNMGVALTGPYVVDTTSFYLQISLQNPQMILYTTDSTDPVPGTSSTWNGGTSTIAFPVSQSRMIVKAMAWNGSGQISPVATLVVTRPAWTRVDPTVVGCLRQVGLTKVYACGDSRGPLAWTASGWAAVDPAWTSGKVQSMYVSDSEVVAVAAGQVYRSPRGNPFVALGASLPGGNVAGITRFGDSLYAAGSIGVYSWNGTSWNPQSGSPTNATGLWTGPDGIYAGQGVQIWKYVWTAGTRAWVSWLDPAQGTIHGFAANPWVSGAMNGPLVLADDGLAELDPSQAILSGNLITDADANHKGLRQVVAYTYNYSTRLFAAFDDGNGAGGIARSGGWSSGWNSVGTSWPGSGSQTSSAMGVAVYKMQNSQILASTPTGTWTLPLQ